jgi:hypothetical protein
VDGDVHKLADDGDDCAEDAEVPPQVAAEDLPRHGGEGGGGYLVVHDGLVEEANADQDDEEG